MYSDILTTREARVNSNEIVLHMCHWDEDQSKFKGKGQQSLAKQAFTFYPSSVGRRCPIMFNNSLAI